jgi:hypothetical protein
MAKGQTKYQGRFAVPQALAGGGLAALVVPKNQKAGGTVVVWSSKGKKVGEHAFPPKAVNGSGRSAAGEAMFVNEEQVFAFGADAKPKTVAVKGVQRGTFLSNGSLVVQIGAGDVKLRDDSGKTTDLVEIGAGNCYFPVVLADDSFALVAKEQPRRLLVFDKNGKQTLDAKLASNVAGHPIATTDGRVAIAAGEMLHVFGPGKKEITAKLGGELFHGPLALADGWLVCANKRGEVETFDAEGKRRASFRRDPIGGGENTIGIAVLADGTIASASTNGTVYKWNRDGKLLGGVEVGTEIRRAIALVDGVLVLERANVLHFIEPSAYGPVDALGDAPDMSAEIPKLADHLAPLALTPRCKEILAALLERLIAVDRKGDVLTLTLLTDEQESYAVKFGEPGERDAGKPKSYNAVATLHGSIVFGDGVPDEIEFGEFNGEIEDEDRFTPLCDAGQNWLVFDKQNKNELGEPRIVLFDHGADITESEPFPGQDTEAFGVGGVLLRALGHRVFSKNDDYDDFGWG